MAGGISNLPNAKTYTPEEAQDAGLGALKGAAYLTPAAPAVASYDIGQALSGSVKDWLYRLTGGAMGENANPVTRPIELSREDFYAKRVPQMKSVDAFVKEAQDAARATKGFEDLGKNGQASRLEKARQTGITNYETYKTSLPDLQAKADKEWAAELADRDERKNAANRMPWYERYPGVGEAAFVLGGLGSAGLARRGVTKIATEGAELLRDVNAARAAGNIGAEAEALTHLDAFRRAVPGKYAWTATKAAAVPLELRSIGTGIDATTMPEVYNPDGSIDQRSARQQARSIMHRVVTDADAFKEEVLPSLVSGATGAGLGSFFAKKLPYSEIRGQKRFVPEQSRGRSGAITQSPDEMALTLADKRMALIEKQRELDAARAMPPLSVPPPANTPPATALAPPATNSGGVAAIGPSPAGGAVSPKTTNSPKRAPRKAAQGPVTPAPTPSNPPKSASVSPDKGLASIELSRFLRGDQYKKAILAGALPAGGMGALMDLESDEPALEDGYARGGAVEAEPVHAGPLRSHVPGRTDHLPISVVAGSYVIPADVVSALGEGNTQAGERVMADIFPPQPQRLEFAKGGKAGGEYVLTPEQVASIGGGDLNAGHAILDHWVKATRAHTVKTLSTLPGPAQ